MDRTYSEQYLDLWHNHWWWRARHRFVLRHVQELALLRGVEQDAGEGGGKLRILDVGCCGGVAFDDWSRFGEVWGLEPDEQLAISTPKWAHRVTHASLEELETPETKFDLIILLDVLEHIEDDRAALGCLRDLLAPGGSLLITVPAFPILWSAHDVTNFHFRRYRRSELRERLEAAGFEPSLMHFFFGWIFGAVFLRRFVARGQQPYHVDVPPAPINRLLENFCRAEQWLFRALHLSPPIGSSLIAVADRAKG